MTEALIHLAGIQKYYGEYHALRGIDLDIRAGEFFSLLGPSGCGKTTLLRVIAGFEDVSEGVVMLDGRDVRGVSANRRPTNMVFQSYAIFPHLTVAQNVGFGLRKRVGHGCAAKAAAVVRRARHGGPRRLRRPRRARALGRAAAARGARARADPAAEGAAARRAAERARHARCAGRCRRS